MYLKGSFCFYFSGTVLSIFMRLIPLVKAGLLGLSLVSIFLWYLSSFFYLFFCLLLVGFAGLFYINLNTYRYWFGFIMFLLTEILAFGTLFVCCLSAEPCLDEFPLSDSFELPLLGRIFLLGSSVTVTTYHHYLGLRGSVKWLWFTVFLGLCFLFIQILEFYSCLNAWSDRYYYSCCFSVVGLHFSHVMIGLVGLSYMIYLSVKQDRCLSYYYATIMVWYWHFVDYVWLFVYFVVYIC